jgi:hypothetical protein
MHTRENSELSATSSKPLLSCEQLIQYLVEKAKSKSKKVVFLVGSPLVEPETPSGCGVPSVSDMAKKAGERLGRELSTSGNNASDYRESFREVIETAGGVDAANRIVEESVLLARKDQMSDVDLNSFVKGKWIDPAILSEEAGKWHLSKGVESLGRIVAEFADIFGDTVLTSNFDPLIEFSIYRAGGSFVQIILPSDADLSFVWSAGSCKVIHFHGFWLKSDTLHISHQVEALRPKLENSLVDIIKTSVVVVLAYGGWQDVFMKALMRACEDASAQVDVRWTFYSKDWSQSNALVRKLLDSPAYALGRLMFHGGVDVREFFPSLLAELRRAEPAEKFESRTLFSGDDSIFLDSISLRVRSMNTDLRSFPFDLASVWGLDRGNFVGVLYRRYGVKLYSLLTQSELALWRAREACGDCATLQTRRWLNFGPGLPLVPNATEELRTALSKRVSSYNAHLPSTGSSEELLGFVFEIGAKDKIERFARWCEALIKLFGPQQVAIVAEINDMEAQELAEWPRLISGVAMHVSRFMQLERVANEKRKQSEHARSAPQAWVGSPLLRWAGLEEKRAQEPDPMLWLREQINSSPVQPGDDLQFLEAVMHADPQKIWSLLPAYAGSSRKQAQRESLLFALRTDAMMDSWLSGADLSEGGDLQALCAVADSDRGVVVNDVALALMRARLANVYAEECSSLLEVLRDTFSSALRSVYSLYRGDQTVDEFVSAHGLREYSLALRAGIDLWPSIDLLRRIDLEHAEFWWLLCAQPVTKERIVNILLIKDPARRAVFGLCSPEEWGSIEVDPNLHRRVVDARRGRELLFIHRG